MKECRLFFHKFISPYKEKLEIMEQKTMKGHKHSLNKYHQWADEVQVGKEAEQREERKWKKIFFIMALCVSLSFCAVFFVTCSLFETATITNLALSVVMMLVITSAWLIMILYLIIPRIYPKIPLINNVQLKYYGCFDFGNKWVSENIEVFKQFDDKKIIIDATSPTRNGAAILYIAILITLALFDFYPKVYDNLLDGDIWGTTQAYTVYHRILDERGVLFTNNDNAMINKLSFASNMALASVYAIFILLALLSVLSPRRTVIFDREKKTITIPPCWRIHKAETIPFYDAVITFGAKVDKKSFKGDEEIVIANYKHLVKGVSLQFAGRTNGYCFARLIQAYMTEDDLSNHPEFEAFRQIQEEININRQ